MRIKGSWTLIATVAGIGLSGCTVGPDYRRPATTMPVAFAAPVSPTTAPTTHPSETNPQAANLVQWWTTFDDPLLTSLIQRAAAGNLDLQQAEARIRQARAARDVVVGDFWPSVDASAAYSRSQAPSGRVSGGTLSSNGARDLFQAGLDASWELDIFGGTRRDIEAATADLQASMEDRRDVLVTLVSEVAINYIALRGDQQQIAIARDNLAAQQHSADVTQKRFSGGFASGLDVANAQAQVATTAAQIPLLQAAARQTIYSLGVLLGQQPQALLGELDQTEAIPRVPAAIPVGLPSDLLRRRPDIRRAEAQLHAATARIGVATADQFPRFSLTGSLGVEGDKASSLTNWSNRFWSVGPSVSWPLFDAGKIRANIRVQNAIQEQALLAYRSTVLTALSDVDSSLVAFAREQEHYKALSEAVAANRRAVDLATRLYADGQTDFLNVLTAQRSLYASQDALVQSSRAIATDLVSLYKALGGGWKSASNQSPQIGHR
jgi:NodT family efflux transporter outer membrane factor (OMF) lipoprotein